MNHVLCVYDRIDDESTCFGPYPTEADAERAAGTLDLFRYDAEVLRLRGLSEELDNPGGTLFSGDSPTE